MNDSEKFNGFVKNKLSKRLFKDISDYYIFNERDLHSATSIYLRDHYIKRDSNSSLDVFVRCEPKMKDGSKPDIVVFRKYDPMYLVQLKMFKNPTETMRSHKEKIFEDLDKLKSYIKKYNSIKWAFLVFIYDSNEMYEFKNYTLNKLGYDKKISVITINLPQKICDNVTK